MKAARQLITSGEVAQKKTPYDWCVVTDHAEYFGVFPQLSDPKSNLITQNKDNEIIKLILSGATGVWAPENTREAVFDGILRKETFGTSAP